MTLTSARPIAVEVFTQAERPVCLATARLATSARDAALDAIFRLQKDDGHWCAELEGDSILTSEYLLMKVILGQEAAPEATPEQLKLWDRLLVHMRRLQRDDGTWGQYPGAPADLSACVKAYYVLKLFGDDVNAPHMVQARDAIRSLGGAEKINTFSMFYLACLGQVSWDACPAIPPEIVLLPEWFPFHLNKVAAWTRTMILPLAICSALRPVRQLPPEKGIDELFIDVSRKQRLNKEWIRQDVINWNNAFLAVDAWLKTMQHNNLMLLRKTALKKAEEWIVARMGKETTDGLGAIFPPMVYAQVALKAMGYERSHPVIVNAERELDRFIVDEADQDHARIQPCFSPVWDTGTALYAVTEAGLTAGGDERVKRVCDWLRVNEVSLVGDWVNNLRPQDRDITMGAKNAHKAPTPEKACGAWAFEYRNDWYPDVDDTAMVTMALRRAGDVAGSAANREASERGIRWILAMQNDDGGWAAFDRTKHRGWMEYVPFADHNAMQDPSCADITGRVLESLVTCGLPTDHPAIKRALVYLKREQLSDGCWWGRWGINYIYGTWQAVGGLVACGEDPRHPALQKAAAWLKRIQNDDGGWGESANSYLDDDTSGGGPSTASQTAWAIISLMNILGPNDEAVERGVRYLAETQLKADAAPEPPLFLHHEPAGSWREQWFTGTGFPKVFYLRYHMYRLYFPLMALARYARLTAQN